VEVKRVYVEPAFRRRGLARRLMSALESSAAAAGHGSVVSAEMLLVLGTLACTVAGHYALLPLMEAARFGQGRWSFAALHGVSLGFYAVKGLLVLALAWRAAGRTPGP
jgi:GNAT superfamily N-acetyltransferase